MKNSHRIIAAFVCAIALLALPAHAAPDSGEISHPPIEQIGSWLSSVWDGLLELILGPPPAPATSTPQASLLGDGGSCIDPNGCNH